MSKVRSSHVTVHRFSNSCHLLSCLISPPPRHWLAVQPLCTQNTMRFSVLAAAALSAAVVRADEESSSSSSASASASASSSVIARPKFTVSHRCCYSSRLSRSRTLMLTLIATADRRQSSLLRAVHRRLGHSMEAVARKEEDRGEDRGLERA